MSSVTSAVSRRSSRPKHILSRKRLRYDIDGPECERSRAAARALAELELWHKRRAAVSGEGPQLSKADEIRIELRMRQMMRRLKEWDTMATMTN